ncbi:MAG: hypothetical protein V2A73_09200 [Pseudomonadota bacterium]
MDRTEIPKTIPKQDYAKWLMGWRLTHELVHAMLNIEDYRSSDCVRSSVYEGYQQFEKTARQSKHWDALYKAVEGMPNATGESVEKGMRFLLEEKFVREWTRRYFPEQNPTDNAALAKVYSENLKNHLLGQWADDLGKRVSSAKVESAANALFDAMDGQQADPGPKD